MKGFYGPFNRLGHIKLSSTCGGNGQKDETSPRQGQGLNPKTIGNYPTCYHWTTHAAFERMKKRMKEEWKN
jgi:hypothetical protein